MNILRLIRFPVICLALSGVLTGFYTVLFAGLGVEKIGYLPHVIIIGLCLVCASSAWNELFCSVNQTALNTESVVPARISMSLGFVVASVLMLIALMLSMAVSLLTFFVAAAIIVNSFIYNSLFRDIPLLDAVFFALQYTLIIVLGMSAHSYLIYLFNEPAIYIPLGAVFMYMATLRVVINVKAVSNCEESKEDNNDVERDSIELSTEIDSIYAGHIESERVSDFEIAKKLSDKMIKRNLAMILPQPFVENSDSYKKKELMVKDLWLTYLGVAILLLIPFAVCFIYSFSLITISLLALVVIFLIFPIFRIISKKNVSSIGTFYRDGIVSVSLLNAIIIVASSHNLLTKQTLTLVVILLVITLSQIILKKYFDKIA